MSAPRNVSWCRSRKRNFSRQRDERVVASVAIRKIPVVGKARGSES